MTVCRQVRKEDAATTSCTAAQATSMAWAVKASVKAVFRRARHDEAAAAAGEPGDSATGRDRLLVEMEAAFVGSVEITTYMTPQDLRVEVHLSYDGGPDPDGEGEN